MAQDKAIIVHPLFKHTLKKPPISTASQSNWNELPLELVQYICCQLTTARCVLTFEGVCKACRSVASDNDLWRKLCFEKFGSPRNGEPKSWRHLYRYNHKILYDIIMYRRPDKLMNLGNGIIYINIPVMALALKS